MMFHYRIIFRRFYYY